MFKSKFSKLCTLLLVFGILFSTCSVSYAETPKIGKPNSTLEMYNRDGSLRRRRQFDENGKAKKDVDYNHTGENHEFPHVHDWKWKGDESKRDDASPKEGELEEAEEKVKKEKEEEQAAKKSKEAAKDAAKGITIGAALGTALYFIISEGSRVVFPPRNLIPIL